MTEIVYYGSKEARKKLQEWVDAGYTLLCPRCKSVLIIALDAKAAATHKVHPGVYCKRNPSHFFEVCELILPRDVK